MNDVIPKETETIAARRAARLSEKLRETGKELGSRKEWWSNNFLDAFFLVLILGLNFYMVYPLFGTSAPDSFFSGPVIPLLARAIQLFEIEFLEAVQIVNVSFFLLFQLSFYIFVRSVTKRKLAGVFSTLIVSLPFYPFAYVRISSSMLGADAAHVASLSLVPLALYGLLSFIRKGGINYLVVAAVSSSIIALISPFGFLTFFIFAAITTFSETLLGTGRLKLTRLIMVLIFAGGLVSFWYNPGFFIWMITGPMGNEIRGTVLKLIPISFFTIPILGAFGYLLFDRKPNLQPVFLAIFYSASFLLISVVGGGIFPSNPSRYVSEFGISLSFAIGIILVRLSDYFKFTKNPKLAKFKTGYMVNATLALVFIALIGAVLVGRDIPTSSRQVLGVWSGVDKGDIWRAKDQFGETHKFFGYSITIASVIILGALKKMGKR